MQEPEIKGNVSLSRRQAVAEVKVLGHGHGRPAAIKKRAGAMMAGEFEFHSGDRSMLQMGQAGRISMHHLPPMHMQSCIPCIPHPSLGLRTLDQLCLSADIFSCTCMPAFPAPADAAVCPEESGVSPQRIYLGGTENNSTERERWPWL